jgi:hypothetical protein
MGGGFSLYYLYFFSYLTRRLRTRPRQYSERLTAALTPVLEEARLTKFSEALTLVSKQTPA